MAMDEQSGLLESLRALYRGRAGGLVLEQAQNAAWLLGGRVQVGIAGSKGICDVVICDSGVYVVTSNIEKVRLSDEENANGLEILAYPWQDAAAREDILQKLCPGGYLTDSGCAAALESLRTILTPRQQQILRENCASVSEILQEVCFEVTPGMTEYEIAGLTARKVYAAGMEPVVLLAACDERVSRYRHALPTSNRLERYLMVSLGARRKGIYASITRFVSFGTPSAEILAAQEAASNAAAMLYTETRPGASWSKLYCDLDRFYAEQGFPGEIKLHHQGGLGGFQPREAKLLPDSARVVCAEEVYAWNPSVTGFKNEDMLLIGEAGNEVLTVTPKLPAKTFTYGDSSWKLPQILIR